MASNSKASKTMHARFKSWTVQKRMAEAVRLVVQENWSQSEAARHLGVSRSRVNVNVKARREELAAAQRRSEAAQQERLRAQGFLPTQEEEGGDDLEGEQEDSPSQVVIHDPNDVIQNANTQPPVFEERRIQPPAEFIRTYFGNVICPDCGVHHEVPPFHDEMIEKITDPKTRRLLINVAPYHAKSTIATVYSSIYEICRNPNTRLGVTSKATPLARSFLYQIKKFLADPAVYGDGPSLIDDWGPFHNTDHWSQDTIYVAGRQTAEKDPTVRVLSVGAQIYGYRFDRIMFDDIADLDNQRNPDTVAEMLQWAVQECATRVGKTGQLCFVGTRIFPQDIYSHLANLPAFEVIRYPCIIDEQGRRTLWQEHYPYENASEQRDSMSLEQFQLVFQNMDTPGFGATFPLDVLEESKDSQRPLGHYDPSWRLVLGVDPAGAGEQAGYTAMVVLGIDLVSGRRYIVDIINHKQMRAPQIKDQIIDFADKYPLAEVRVETNGLQSQLFQYDTELIQKLTQRGVRFVPHITTGRNKWDDQFGVEAMGPMFYNKQISCPTMDINSRKKVGELLEQLGQFPMGLVNDIVMALWFADLGCKELLQRFQMPGFDGRMKMPKRLRRKRHVVDFGSGTVRRVEQEDIGDPHEMRPKDRQTLVNVAPGVSVY